MVAHCDRLVRVANYDMRMALYFNGRRTRCYYTVPSLVSHRVGAGEPSLVAGRGNAGGRVAFNFIGEDRSALEIDWSLL